MAKRDGRCLNREGKCSNAEDRIVLQIDEESFFCPQCKEPLQPVGGNPPKPPIPWKPILIGCGVVAAIVMVIRFWPQGKPELHATPDILLFKGEMATADIRITNNGDGELIIDSVEVSPSVFSLPQGKVTVAPKDAGKLSVRFQSPSTKMTEGELVLHSNDEKSKAVTIKLIANRDPWWVYDKLDESSKTKQKEH